MAFAMPTSEDCAPAETGQSTATVKATTKVRMAGS
jgi:hypothetical protein